MDKGTFETYVEHLDNLCGEVSKKISYKLDENLDFGVTPQQFLIMKMINKNKFATPSILAEQLNVRPSAITAILERMIKNNLLMKEKNENDRRTVHLLLTSKGEQKLASSEMKRQYMISHYLTKFNEAELQQIISIYEKFNEILEMEGSE